MFDILHIFNNEIKTEIEGKRLEYLFKKFLLQNGAYKEYVDEYLRYHYKSNCSPKDVIHNAVLTLKLNKLSVDLLINSMYVAFNWDNTRKGSKYWSSLDTKWYYITKRMRLCYIFVK